ncbi:MAG: hypothetical protein J6B54_02795 [Clostridia bacterium]|nr:hypothetical protein [Clostridia bacterium]
MNKKVTSIVSYCTIIGWLVAYLAGDKENAKFHLNQGLVLGIFGTGIGIIVSIVTGILNLIAAILNNIAVVAWLFGALAWVVGLIGSVAGILTAVLIVVGILNAVNDKEEKLPVIGGITILK